MVLEPCTCNHGVPGVTRLPNHTHPWSPNDRYEEVEHVIYRGTHAEVRHRLRAIPDPDAELHFWVDWKAVARG